MSVPELCTSRDCSPTWHERQGIGTSKSPHCLAEGADPTAGMSERQKKLFELQQRLKASRKANQSAVVAERRRKQAPEGADVASDKRKWFEEKKKRKEAELKRLGISEKDVRILQDDVLAVRKQGCRSLPG